MNRMRAWLVVAPAIAAGVLASHTVAYALVGTPWGSTHEYLAHAPQVVAVLAVVGLALGSLGPRIAAPRTALFPVAAIGTFVVQEHLERLVHTGELPVLVSSPAFLVGLALQLPVALLVWVVARWMLATLGECARAPAALASISLEPATLVGRVVPSGAIGSAPGRGPPSALHR